LLPVLSKSRCEVGIAAVEPLRKMVQGVDSRPFHRMGIAQPSNERVHLVCHGLGPPPKFCLTKGSTIWSRKPPRVQPEDLPGSIGHFTPAAANGQLFLTRFNAPRISTTCIGSPPHVGADL